jgi:hypothetical protein
MIQETTRLQKMYRRGTAWREWGPYLSEQPCGTVRAESREDTVGTGAGSQPR